MIPCYCSLMYNAAREAAFALLCTRSTFFILPHGKLHWDPAGRNLQVNTTRTAFELVSITKHVTSIHVDSSNRLKYSETWILLNHKALHQMDFPLKVGRLLGLQVGVRNTRIYIQGLSKKYYPGLGDRQSRRACCVWIMFGTTHDNSVRDNTFSKVILN